MGGKPVIGARYKLWQGYDTPATLAAKLNRQTTDPTSQNGYSLIAVHAWSSSVADIVATASLLDDSRVRVVGPDQFVQLVAQNVRDMDHTM